MVKNCNHFVTKCGGNWMAALGMICEWNPFHLGHAWLLRGAEAVLWPTRGVRHERQLRPAGRAAVAEKRARAEMALRCGADVVFELPTVWAMASAERFARGGVALRRRTGVVTPGGLRLGVRRRGSAYARCGMSRRRGLPRGTAASARGRGHVRRLPRTRGGGAARRDGRGTSQRAEQYLGIEYCRALRGAGSVP